MIQAEYLLGNLKMEKLLIQCFTTGEHVIVAFQMLEKYDFVEASARYASMIKNMAASMGELEKFNATITFSFISLSAERRSSVLGDDVDTFLAKNQDVLRPKILENWYSSARLYSQQAREQFLLPDQILG